MPRSLRPWFGFVSCMSAAIALAACGPPPTAQTEPRAAPPAKGGEVVVPGPEAAAGAAATDDGAPPVLPGERDLEMCIAQLRGHAGGPDPAKATGSVEYQDAMVAQVFDERNIARDRYLALIKKYPESTLVAAAYFNLGEMYAAAAPGDPGKLVIAEQCYREAIKDPAGPDSMRTVATYRLGRLLRASKPQEALSVLRRLVNVDRDAATDGCAAEIPLVVARASAEVFAEVAQPEKCWSLFLPAYGGDAARTSWLCMEVADDLVARKEGKGAAALLAVSVEAGLKAQPDGNMRIRYCTRAKAAAEGARTLGATSAALGAALAAACD